MTVDLEEIRRAREEADCLCTPAEVDAALNQLAADITVRLQDKNPLVYVVMNGGLILAGRLLPRLPFPLELAYLHATRYGHALQGTLLDWRVRPTQDLRDRNVLVLDDILDEGHTLAAIIDYLKQEGAREVHSAVLVHKVHDRKAYPGMRADFTGLDVADRFLFGGGMDYKGYWRNAPGIYALKGH
ncbi:MULTISPECIES: hypoxanthine-guanine phosphoribosyltransferase [Zoogloeaceae]|jgi:hypoxanthine phosphoribosyltransferase|uniref:Hypoxanthine-guanine phosphoribosyltransferase n=1 Tax=Thauera aminoaromatica TaxID=164330 RepID=A0A5C7T7C6_THASP|nr:MULTISPECIES: hypoxanthine-guanine phosphoribosyltransferase [Zoogloeaceae]MBK6655687.1 hypoxanthine-guanine phosphoribosyltransferase [Zoogloea sp.]MBK7846826.1 hypoxanthine-guanine phosphoribosyltransferase [Zoogloea sp.]MBP7444613.1 hypoxanthine-guanine phosphoribosyltransferase [Zoogloea sp.]TXH92094.1 MAG: hypoxanthine-guanine phosphoribosyltransferase [Thauera aminoaromatica]HPI59051.1 hypoxanthine-guanine phosphoribosyltransferase [Zoogloea sp.]